MGAWYVDTSAAAKLVAHEAHSESFRSWALRDDTELVASDLTRAELIRATRRTDPSLLDRALEVLDALDIVPLPPRLFRAAGLLDPTTLRALDALHLAVALDLADDLDGLACYDGRLADAARAHGLRVVAPGA